MSFIKKTNKNSDQKLQPQINDPVALKKIVILGAIITASLWIAFLYIMGGIMSSNSSQLVIGSLITFKGKAAGGMLYIGLGTAFYSFFSVGRCLFKQDRFGHAVLPIVTVSLILSTSFFQVMTESAVTIGAVVGLVAFQAAYFVHAYKLRYVTLLEDSIITAHKARDKS